MSLLAMTKIHFGDEIVENFENIGKVHYIAHNSLRNVFNLPTPDRSTPNFCLCSKIKSAAAFVTYRVRSTQTSHSLSAVLEARKAIRIKFIAYQSSVSGAVTIWKCKKRYLWRILYWLYYRATNRFWFGKSFVSNL